jgi:diadenosine tetraphosphatase ApaH/serine/threonine PP2A family protein phosphatase
LRYAFLSDIHSNLEALTSALNAVENRRVDRIVCLGDIIGYGADPSACLKLVRENADYIILGNHDAGVVGTTELQWFNDFARAAVLWTRSVLSDDEKDFLRSLPLEDTADDLHFVHGTPHDPEGWHYIFSSYDVIPQFPHIKGHTCFVGHSHIPGDYREKPSVPGEVGTARRIINVGSVGQPRDRDPRLCCAIYDSETRHLELIREEYDIQTAAAKIRQAGLPDFLAERLNWGQ